MVPALSSCLLLGLREFPSCRLHQVCIKVTKVGSRSASGSTAITDRVRWKRSLEHIAAVSRLTAVKGGCSCCSGGVSLLLVPCRVRPLHQSCHILTESEVGRVESMGAQHSQLNLTGELVWSHATSPASGREEHAMPAATSCMQTLSYFNIHP